MRPPAARAAMDRISHAVGFDTTPIETALTLSQRGKVRGLRICCTDNFSETGWPRCFFSPPEFWKRNPTVPTDLRSDSGWLPVTV